MQTAVKPSKPKASVDDNVDHFYCCDPDESLCGLDISELPILDFLPDICVVCDDLAPNICERCGE